MEKQSAAFPHPANNVAHNSIKRGVIHITHNADACGIPFFPSSFLYNQKNILADYTISMYDNIKISKKIGVPKHPHFLNPLAKFAVLVYNHLRTRRILERPTVVQSETYNALKINGLQAIPYCRVLSELWV